MFQPHARYLHNIALDIEFPSYYAHCQILLQINCTPTVTAVFQITLQISLWRNIITHAPFSIVIFWTKLNCITNSIIMTTDNDVTTYLYIFIRIYILQNTINEHAGRQWYKFSTSPLYKTSNASGMEQKSP